MQITDEDRERAKEQPLIILVHREYRWTLPALANDFFARILPELIASSRRDARLILSQPVSPAAYGYFALLCILIVGMKAACLLCRWSRMKRKSGAMGRHAAGCAVRAAGVHGEVPASLKGAPQRRRGHRGFLELKPARE